jgi:hypothetical protein
MPAKRGDRVAPPARPDGWEARFATSEAAKGWEELCRAAQANTWEAWVVLTERPTQPENPSRQHRLRGQLAERQISGRTLPQWQYEVTAGGRIWYCPDGQRRAATGRVGRRGESVASEGHRVGDRVRPRQGGASRQTSQSLWGAQLEPDFVDCGVELGRLVELPRCGDTCEQVVPRCGRRARMDLQSTVDRPIRILVMRGSWSDVSSRSAGRR